MRGFLAFALLAVSFLAPASALAGSGKAIVPYWVASPQHNTAINISNITDNTLNVSITFYDLNGAQVPNSSVIYSNMLGGNTQIGPKKTAGVALTGFSAISNGFAVITWSNSGTGNDVVGLTAHAFRHYSDASRASESSIPVNNGMPF